MKATLLTLTLLIAGILVTAAGATETMAQGPTQTPVPTSPTPTRTPTVAPPAITDAAATRDALLATAQQNLDAQAATGFLGFFPQWRGQYPGLIAGGSVIVATGAGIVSTSYNNLNPKDGDGPDNPTVIALAVGDTSGRCAGAVLYGFPKTDKVMKIASPSPCTAQGIVAAFKVAFTGPSQVATPTAVAAPKPPATGSGADQGEGRKVPLFAVALAMLGGATFLAVRFRRA